MYQFVVRRLLTIVVMMVAISIVTFVLFFVTPKDPARYSCGNRCTGEIIKNNRHALGLDKPKAVQYLDFVKGLFVGRDFPDDPKLKKTDPEKITHCSAPALGYSFTLQECVSTTMKKAFPITFSLAVGAFVMWILVGVGFGVLAALRKGSVFDKAVTGTSLVAYSLPTFFIGLTLLNIVSIKYGALPAPEYVPFFENPLRWASGLLAPWITLASVYAAMYVRITRASMIESMSEDFVRTARAKGLARSIVVGKHGLRAALTPIVTIAGLDVGAVLAGAGITEQVFNMQGIGNTAISAITESDLPIITATVLIAAFVVVLMNFVVDMLYAVIDPRVRLA